MPRQDKLTSKFKVWKRHELVAIIDAPNLEAAKAYAAKTWGGKLLVRQVEAD